MARISLRSIEVFLATYDEVSIAASGGVLNPRYAIKEKMNITDRFTPKEHHLYKWLKETRRYFHMYPETANREFDTTKKIREILNSLGVEILESESPKTGVVALLRGKTKGKTIALRADIDALPITEENRVSYRSKNEGVMHACGHDAHTTIMLGTAKNLIESGALTNIKGQIKFIFQPAEEGLLGALQMIKAGVLKNPSIDMILACHMDPSLPTGQVALFRGISHAMMRRFQLTIKGRGCHGAAPHKGIDPINVGAYFVTAVQSIISRNINPLDSGVVTIGEFHAGSAPNIIPDKVMMTGTIRVLKDEVLELIVKRLSEIAEGIEKTFCVTVDLNIKKNNVPALINDESATNLLFNSVEKSLGGQNILFLPPVMGSEDFALFTQAVPGAMTRIGCSKNLKGCEEKRLHSPHFDIDEAVLPIGVEIFTETVKMFL